MSDALPLIVGHEEAQNTLGQLFASGKLPHAMLFHGPKGLGKRLVAEYCVRRLICGPQNGADESVLFNTSSPLYPQIQAGSSPDVHIIEPVNDKKSISIEQVRKVLEALSLSSDGDRIVVVDSADELTISAANALLKTLEEPGAGVHLILISHNLSRLLPTIISRCRKIPFFPLDMAQTQRVLTDVLPDHDDLSRATLSELAQGAPGAVLKYVGVGEEVAKMMAEFMAQVSTANVSTAITIAETIQRKKAAGVALEFLMTHMASGAREEGAKRLIWAQLHQRTLQKQLNMEEYNLNAQLVLESSMADVISSLQA